VAKKRKKNFDPDDIPSVRYGRALVRKAWAEMGVDDPEARAGEIMERIRAELAARQAESP
jgi:hypothetical protein